MSEEITIRRATLADREAIAAFLPRAYPGRWQYKYPHRWEWAYLHNPYLEEGLLPVWIAVTPQGKVVGQTCALLEPLKLGEQARLAAWSVDTFLDPAFRGRGIGYRLQEANQEANEIFMSLSMSAANRRIKEKLGGQPLEEVQLLVRTMRHEPERAVETLARRLAPGANPLGRTASQVFTALGLDRALAAGLNARRQQADLRLSKRADHTLAFDLVPEFGAELDGLWRQAGQHFYALVQRDSAYLNWKYVQQPHMDYQRIVARRAGAACGYLVLRIGQPPEPHVGIIADLFAAPQDEATLHALLVRALAYFHQQGVESATAATTSPAYLSVYRRFGFRPVKAVRPMGHCRGADANWARALEPGAWLLGKGDHDWDQYPNA